ncbi:hypothetical protein JL720_7036 [Aureococcus anophagefferens]|nr:hypothetical protein JL720_7036 [Aureococcus anophagefferens]
MSSRDVVDLTQSDDDCTQAPTPAAAPRPAPRPAAAPRPAPTPAAAPRPVKTPAAPAPPAEVTPDAPAPPRAAPRRPGRRRPELKRAEKRRRLGAQASQESEEDQLARILAESEETERARSGGSAQASQESEEDQLARILAESAATAEAEARARRGSAARRRRTKAADDGRDKAQYGRLFFGATRTVAELTNLKASEVFVDIGCGVGNATMQMACTVGCEARGIELMPDRHIVGHEHMWPALQHAIGERDGPPPKVGEVVLRQADLADPAIAEFLSSADVAFVNNYNEIFGARSCKHGERSLDEHVARVFACMKPGSRMVTFHPLALGMDAEKSLEKACFLCTNRKCVGKDIPTAFVNEESLDLVTECIFCGESRRPAERDRGESRRG